MVLFESAGEDVDVAEFAQIVRQTLISNRHYNFKDDLQFANAITAVFTGITKNNSAFISWDDVISYLVSIGKSIDSPVFLRKYIIADRAIDYRTHRTYISTVRAISEISLIISYNCTSRSLSIYKRNLRLECMINDAHQGELLAFEYLPEHALLATSGSDKTVAFWSRRDDRQTWELSRQWQLPYVSYRTTLYKLLMYWPYKGDHNSYYVQCKASCTRRTAAERLHHGPLFAVNETMLYEEGIQVMMLCSFMSCCNH